MEAGKRNIWSLLLNQQDPNQIARNMHYYGYLSRARAEDIDALRANLQRLDALTRAKPTKKAWKSRAIQVKQAEHKK